MLKRNTKTDSENDKNYLTVEEFNAIRRMDFPKDFLDFLEIGFRTGLRAADILNLKKENIVLTKNDDDSLTGRIHGTALKTKSQTQINIKLDQISLSILKNRLENTKFFISAISFAQTVYVIFVLFFLYCLILRLSQWLYTILTQPKVLANRIICSLLGYILNLYALFAMVSLP